MPSLVLLRHGESEWNRDGRFAGWRDIGLTETGVAQSRQAGAVMRAHGLEFSICYTSVLKRAIHTAWHCLDAMDRTWLPMVKSWQLNERHYGALHGLSKEATAMQFGEDQLKLWRRSFSQRPPPSPVVESEDFARDPRYAGVAVPLSESIEDTVVRARTLWEQTIRPATSSGSPVLIVAHGTSIRALIKVICGLSETQATELEPANAEPLLIELDEGKQPAMPHRMQG